MNLNELLESPSAWLSRIENDGIVITSRVRLARNLKTALFPSWGSLEDCQQIWELLQPVLTRVVESYGDNLALEFSDIDEMDRLLLFERYLISREQADKSGGSGVVVTSDEALSIMVNEEDHLRIQALAGGLNLQEAYDRVNAVDDAIEVDVDYAWDDKLGYLTACPSNVGSGMRASCMLHVPALVLMNEIGPIIKGLGKIGLAVRGLGGEGSDAAGNLFQVSNQITLGESEREIIKNLSGIVEEIVEHEKNARVRLMQKREEVVRDHVGRSLGILSNAHILTSKEALDLLSGLRLGIDLNIIDCMETRVLDDLLLQIRPGHLQRREGRALKAQERDIARAQLVRTMLAKGINH